MKPRAWFFGIAAVAGVFLGVGPACTAGSNNSSSSGSGAGDAAGPGSQSGSGGIMLAGGGVDPSGAGGGCVEAAAEAVEGILPADIIVVVDNSGSMTDEAKQVQKSMNDFVNVLVASAIDVHVILLSNGNSDQQGVCVPAPLGNGSCPVDEKLPAFRHVMIDVGSNNGLELVLSTYPQWKDSLRPNATRTIAIITDDESSIGAQEFIDQLLALDPSFKGFKFDGIFAPHEVSPLVCGLCQQSDCKKCDPCCGKDPAIGLLCLPLPAAEGKVYKELVAKTGGVSGSLCIDEFLPVFQDMAKGVVADSKIPCVYDIPPAPGGQEIDFGKVNVGYQPAANQPEQEIFYVEGGKAACGPNGGWYYDNPAAPTTLLLCDATCTLVQSGNGTGGKVSVKFGCATKIQ
ncbi:MAG: VWA domain-containing protein [Myxococcales bacterium]|nr:VWA domain-containing protein [Myxococcales bacterium]